MAFSNNFKHFIEATLKEFRETKKKQAYIFYITEVEEIDFQKVVCSLFQTYEKSFFWSDPIHKAAYFSFSEFYSIKENGKNRFLNLDKKIKTHFEPLYSNLAQEKTTFFPLPLYFVAAKFVPESAPDIWKDFDDIYGFIPKWTLIYHQNKTYALNRFQITSESKIEEIIDKFTSQINSFIEISKNKIEFENPRFVNVDIKNPKERKKLIEKIKRTLEKIEENEFEKIVISRAVEIPFQQEPKVGFYFFKLIEQYPDCKIFGFRSGKSVFFGASPETLLKISDGSLYIEALAGSAAPENASSDNNQKQVSESLFSEKNIKEHHYVVEHIKECLLSKNISEFNIEENKIKKLANIIHIQSVFVAPYNRQFGIFELLDKLHPTPAVAGWPQQIALNNIKKFEDYERGLYSGFIGWIDENLNCDLALGLRSALIANKKLYAFAGNGIVRESMPNEEALENELKLQAITNLIKNEN